MTADIRPATLPAPARPEACRLLLEKLRIARSDDEREALIAELAAPERPLVLAFLNQHGLNLCWSDGAFRDGLAGADVLLRDGIGVSACLRLLGREPGLNLNGTDFIPALAAAYAGRPVLLCGTCAPWLERAAGAVESLGCRVVGTVDGFHPDADYLEAARSLRPALILLGMGMPRQEQVAAALAGALDYPVVIVNGGAVLDFLAGRFPRAPRAVRRLRLEWAFRLALEPRRLWRRYLLGGAAFAWRTLHVVMARV